MAVVVEGRTVYLRTPSRVEDAEAVLAILDADPTCIVELGECGPLHTAVVQILIALQPTLSDASADPFLERWLFPDMRRGAPGAN